MKWFKHDTDAHMSEGVDTLIDILGFAGYGRWNRLLEIVASKMDETERCHAEYSTQKWCSFLGLKQKKLISFLELTQNELKTKVVYYENKIRIEIPNLLKKRDNYTKHLQVESKRLESIDRDKEVDREVEKEVKKKKAVVKAVLPDFISEEAWQGFTDMRKKIKSPLSDHAITLALNKLGKFKEEGQDPNEILNQSTMNGWKGLFPVDKQGQGKSKTAGNWDLVDKIGKQHDSK